LFVPAICASTGTAIFDAMVGELGIAESFCPLGESYRGGARIPHCFSPCPLAAWQVELGRGPGGRVPAEIITREQWQYLAIASPMQSVEFGFDCEMVLPRCDLVHRCVRLASQQGHAGRLVGGDVALAHGRACGRRDIDRRRSVGRDCDPPVEFATLRVQRPGAADRSVDRVQLHRHAGQVTPGPRTHDDVPVAGPRRIEVDPANHRVEPRADCTPPKINSSFPVRARIMGANTATASALNKLPTKKTVCRPSRLGRAKM
jgi:hypothetical protein